MAIAAVAGIAIIAVLSSLYTVPADAEAIVQRFGRYHSTASPGLRLRIPFGVDRVTILPVRRELKQEFGFGPTPGATNPSQAAAPRVQAVEKNMVTGDLNAALVEWVVQYRIEDPRAYLFTVRRPADTLRDVSESVMREVVGDRTVDEVITIGRQEIEADALAKMQELVNKYGLGLSINQVQLKDVNPPAPVQASFNEVNQAQQERERAINIARGEYNKVVPRARGRADQAIQGAEGYATERVNRALGEANRFESIFAAYAQAPEVTRQRMYLETMRGVLPALGPKIVLDGDATQVLPLLSLGRAKVVE